MAKRCHSSPGKLRCLERGCVSGRTYFATDQPLLAGQSKAHDVVFEVGRIRGMDAFCEVTFWIWKLRLGFDCAHKLAVVEYRLNLLPKAQLFHA